MQKLDKSNFIVQGTYNEQTQSCLICLQPLSYPIQCDKCKSMFCQKCASTWKKSKALCPKKCSANPWKFTSIETFPILLRCPFLNQDCKNMSPQQFDVHYKICQKGIIKPRYESMIVEDFTIIKQFFKPKKIERFELLFRASQHQSVIEQFHQLCDKVPNTLVIAKTQFNKIIGGYTPLEWNQNKNGFQTDHQKQSFIFSVTQNLKIPITQNFDKAIKNSHNSGPIFGEGQCFWIHYSNSVTNNGIYIGNKFAYAHKDFNLTQQNFTTLSGQTNGYTFHLLQWEVFQVKMQKLE